MKLGKASRVNVNLRFGLILSVLVVLFLFLSDEKKEGESAVSMTDYCYVPPTTGIEVKPNVLFVVDFSGSMQFPVHVGCIFRGYDKQKVAQCETINETYRPEFTYQGYFDPDKCYKPTNKGFEETPCQTQDRIGTNNAISGNLLNWVTTTRIDVARKVLTGGKSPQATATPTVLISEGAEYTVVDTNLGCNFEINANQPDSRKLSISNIPGKSCRFDLNNVDIKLNLPSGTPVKGVIHDFCDTSNINGQLNEKCKVIMQFMVFSSDERYGEIRVGKNATIAELFSAINNETPYWGTPTGEALWEAYDYYRQINAYPYEANTAYIQRANPGKDPYYDKIGNQEMAVWCRKGFVLLITDGAWNGDVDPIIPAHKMATTDLREDLEGVQSVNTYVVYAWGDRDTQQRLEGRRATIATAIFGGFEDLDNDKWPFPFFSYNPNSIGNCQYTSGGDSTRRSDIKVKRPNGSEYTYCNSRGVLNPLDFCNPGGTWDPKCAEWDTVSGSFKDGLPYNFFEADDEESLRNAILSALYDILRRASSAAAVACLTTQKGFSTLVLQPYYYPKFESQQGERGWLGFFKAFWVDLGKKVGLREDTVVNKVLNLMGDLVDKVIKFVSGPNEVKIAVLKGSEDECSLEAFKDINQALPVFDSGCLLAETNPSQRRILVNLGNVTAEFQSSNATLLSELQQIWKTVDPNVNETVVKCVIEYLRGNDAPIGCSGVRYVQRPRTVLKSEVCREGQGTIVWRLGDIIASTPSVVSDKPTNIYHLKYGDSSYRDFVNSPAYRNRPSLAFVGANDGMLHAFRIGYLQMTQDPRAPAKLLDAPGAETNGYVGREEWAFIPKNAIPYLLWYGDTAYCHVPTVDYRTLVVDVKLDDQWKTVLVGAMGFGGKELGGFSSSVFVLDITDPLNPQVLWERPLPDKTLTLSMPAVIKVRDKWYVVLGTGPKDPHGATFSATSIYFFQLKDGLLVREIPFTEANVAVGDLMPVDVDEDYSDDAIYFGTYGGPTDPKGSFWRLRLRNGQRYLEVSELGSSDLSKAMDLSGFWPKGDKSLPVFAAPAFARGQGDALWVYFGTGRFLTGDDKALGYDNYLIGFKDGAWDTKYNSSPTYGKSDLVDTTSSQVIAQVLLRKPVCICDIGGCKTEWVVYETTGSMGSGVSRGWYFNLGREILFSQPAVMGKTVEALSYVPSNDICEFTGRTNLISLYYESGTAYFRPVVLSPLATEEVQGQPGKVVLLPKVSLGYGSPPYGNPFQTVSGVNPREYSKLVQVSGTLVQVRQQVAYKFRGRVLAWVER